MPGWREVLTLQVNEFDRLKYRLNYALGGVGPVKVIPFIGFGTKKEVHLTGRVLEDRGIPPASDNDTIWNNLVNMYRRFESDEVPHARLKARFYDQVKEVRANEEGIFAVRFHPKEPLPSNQLWHPLELTLEEPRSKEYRATRHRQYKLDRIRQILAAYDRLPFILVGNSEQEDPEIYQQVVAEYPGRAQAVYIRNVSPGLKRQPDIHDLAKKVSAAGSTLILAQDTRALAQHAAGQGWILTDALGEIETEALEDEAPAGLLEKLMEEDFAARPRP